MTSDLFRGRPGQTAATLSIIAAITALQGCGNAHKDSAVGPADDQYLELPAFCLGTAAASPVLPGVTPVADARSPARIWNEQALESIRRDFPRPTVHARNLFHLSAAMYDAWAAYDSVAVGYLYKSKFTSSNKDADLATAIHVAAFRIAMHRANLSFDKALTQQRLVKQLQDRGLNPCYLRTTQNTPADVGNAIAATYITYGRHDGANEGYANPPGYYLDTSGWTSVNGTLKVALPFDIATMANPNQFQLLEMAQAQTQNGIATSNTQSYVTPHWGWVKPFAMQRSSTQAMYYGPTSIPAWNAKSTEDQVLDVIRKTAMLDPSDSTDPTIDVSPASLGNNTLGHNDGRGHAINPSTQRAYTPLLVKRSRFGAALAKYWADGPESETPPGHWNLILNEITDHPKGPSFTTASAKLAWQIKTYFALNAALHDAAISAWEIKRAYLSARPITLIRYRAALGQSSNPSGASYNINGLPLIPGLIEVATAQAIEAGRYGDAADVEPGKVMIKGYEPAVANGGLVMPEAFRWVRGDRWSPYQPANFVTPAFPGLVSGHSTFSRAAAEVLSKATGSIYFPGGVHTFKAKLVAGSTDTADQQDIPVATYVDAADLSGISRIWGGIHIAQDDSYGRQYGSAIGLAAWTKAQTYINGQAR